MRKQIMFVGMVAPLLLAVSSGQAIAQRIVRWVDAQGQVHYSDRAPTDQPSEEVTIHAAPRQSPVSTPAPTASNNRAASPSTTSDADRRAKEATEQQRKWADKQEADEAAKAQADQDVIDRCNRGHEIYCNQGADAIRAHDKMLAQLQYADALQARDNLLDRGIHTPAPHKPPDDSN